VTTVIAVKTATGATMIADSQVTDSTGRVFSTQKISINGSFLISGAGECLPLDIAQHIWKSPVPTAKDYLDLNHFMITKVVPSLRIALERGKYVPDKDDKDAGFSIIFAINGEIFSIDEDFSVSVAVANVIGGGSGSAYAIGAIRAGANVQDAMKIAEENDAWTSGPFMQFDQKRIKKNG
jgi:hypothetical protein